MNAPYTIVYEPAAASFLDHLEKSQPRIHQRIEHDLYRLALTRSSSKIKPLRGKLLGYNRLRVGRDYRIIFRFDHSEGKIYIIAIDHRKDAYRP